MTIKISENDYDIEVMGVDKLIPYKNNPREITREAIDLVKKSIQQNKFSSVIIADKNLEIIAGHTRLMAAKELGIERLPVFIAKNLDEQSVKRLRLIDNKLTENTDWALDKLKQELNELELDDDFSSLWHDLMNTDLSEFDLPEEMIESENEGYGEPIIQYVMVFDNETQQQDWNLYLVKLKEMYPNLGTHAARINADITKIRNSKGKG